MRTINQTPYTQRRTSYLEATATLPTLEMLRTPASAQTSGSGSVTPGSSWPLRRDAQVPHLGSEDGVEIAHTIDFRQAGAARS